MERSLGSNTRWILYPPGFKETVLDVEYRDGVLIVTLTQVEEITDEEDKYYKLS